MKLNVLAVAIALSVGATANADRFVPAEGSYVVTDLQIQHDAPGTLPGDFCTMYNEGFRVLNATAGGYDLVPIYFGIEFPGWSCVLHGRDAVCSARYKSSWDLSDIGLNAVLTFDSAKYDFQWQSVDSAKMNDTSKVTCAGPDCQLFGFGPSNKCVMQTNLYIGLQP